MHEPDNFLVGFLNPRTNDSDHEEAREGAPAMPTKVSLSPVVQTGQRYDSCTCMQPQIRHAVLMQIMQLKFPCGLCSRNSETTREGKGTQLHICSSASSLLSGAQLDNPFLVSNSCERHHDDNIQLCYIQKIWSFILC